jgi:seryl-tRNA synthetase
MKIKITEEQANRLSLLNNNNPIVNVERFSKIKTEIVNRLFSEVLNLTIGESLSGFDKLELIQEKCDNISNDLSKLKRIADDYINSLGDSDSLEHTPESEALELRLDEAQYKLYNKLNTLDNLIHALVKVGKISKNKEFFKWFDNSGPMDITDIQ